MEKGGVSWYTMGIDLPGSFVAPALRGGGRKYSVWLNEWKKEGGKVGHLLTPWYVLFTYRSTAFAYRTSPRWTQIFTALSFPAACHLLALCCSLLDSTGCCPHAKHDWFGAARLDGSHEQECVTLLPRILTGWRRPQLTSSPQPRAPDSPPLQGPISLQSGSLPGWFPLLKYLTGLHFFARAPRRRETHKINLEWTRSKALRYLNTSKELLLWGLHSTELKWKPMDLACVNTL